jgi:hypothetical protein
MPFGIPILVRQAIVGADRFVFRCKSGLMAGEMGGGFIVVGWFEFCDRGKRRFQGSSVSESFLQPAEFCRKSRVA